MNDRTETSPASVASAELHRTEGARREGLASLLLPPFLLGAVLVGLWYFISYVLLDESKRFLLQPPHLVWRNGLGKSEVLTEMLEALWASTKVAMLGLAIAMLIGIAVAVLMSQSRLIERAIFPFSVMLQAIPILAIVPLIGFWFGYGFKSRVLVAILIAVFPIIVNTLFGLLSAEQGMHDLVTLHKGSRLTRLLKIQFPAALPAMFSGFRISAGLSVIGAIVGDFFFGQGEIGIGQLLKRYAARLDGEELFVRSVSVRRARRPRLHRVRLAAATRRGQVGDDLARQGLSRGRDVV